MVELMYAAGLRVSELVNLPAVAVNLRQGVLRVMGKGSKERLVPMGEEAQHWLEKYIGEAQSSFAKHIIVGANVQQQQSLTVTVHGFMVVTFARLHIADAQQ